MTTDAYKMNTFATWEDVLRAKRAGKTIGYIQGYYVLKRERIGGIRDGKAYSRMEWMVEHPRTGSAFSVFDDMGQMICPLESFHVM